MSKKERQGFNVMIERIRIKLSRIVFSVFSPISNDVDLNIFGLLYFLNEKCI